MDLVDALAPDGGVVCAVGAGGKKSTLYALADRFDRAVVTATVRIPIFDSHVSRVATTDEPVAVARRAAAEHWPLGLVPRREPDRDDRYLGYDPNTIDALDDALGDRGDGDGAGDAGDASTGGDGGVADVVLVKADGARMREFKAPGDREPQLPASADVVLPIASVQAVGEPLAEDTVHRPERVAEITGRDPGEPLRPQDVAAVLASTAGGRKDVPADATVRPVLNKVDDAAAEQTARTIAEHLLDRTAIPAVVLAQMTAVDPVVNVVTLM